MKSRVEVYLLGTGAAWDAQRMMLGQKEWGHTAGYLRYVDPEGTAHGLQIDAGLGTIDALLGHVKEFKWSDDHAVLITHGHTDHVGTELAILSEILTNRSEIDGNKRSKNPLQVYATQTTCELITPQFSWQLGKGNTMEFVEITPNIPFSIGVFRITPISAETHFPGACNYVIEFDRYKIFIGWDMKTLPDPDNNAVLKDASLVFLETNTWEALSKITGHVSVMEILEKKDGQSFVDRLDVRNDIGIECPVRCVHFSGYEDSTGLATDLQLTERLDKFYPEYRQVVCVAKRGHQHTFEW